MCFSFVGCVDCEHVCNVNFCSDKYIRERENKENFRTHVSNPLWPQSIWLQNTSRQMLSQSIQISSGHSNLYILMILMTTNGLSVYILLHWIDLKASYILLSRKTFPPKTNVFTSIHETIIEFKIYVKRNLNPIFLRIQNVLRDILRIWKWVFLSC